MSLLAMLKKGGLRQTATAIPATFATAAPVTPTQIARVATVAVANQEKSPANDPTPDPDHCCWPHSTAMTGREIDTFTARLARFTDKGTSTDVGEALADKLVIRDRESDDRRLCLECLHLAGYGPGSWRCGNWQAAGTAIKARDAGLPADLVWQLQRCDGFITQLTSFTERTDHEQHDHN